MNNEKLLFAKIYFKKMKNSAGISIKKNKKIIVINTNKISPGSCNTNFY